LTATGSSAYVKNPLQIGSINHMERWNIGIMGQTKRSSSFLLTHLFYHSSIPIVLFFDGMLEEFFLFDGHFARSFSRSLVFISDQMKNAMDHEEDKHLHRVQAKSIGLALSCLYRNRQVTEKMGMKGGILSFPHREGEDIGGFVSMEVSTIQFLNLDIIDQQDTELGIRKCQVDQYPLGRSSYLF
jgi:hypothetical protein